MKWSKRKLDLILTVFTTLTISTIIITTLITTIIAEINVPPIDSPVSSDLPGLLYPRESESREVKSLDGLWNFALPPTEDLFRGSRNKWFSDDLSRYAEVIQMPVPSSYNDITTSAKLRDFVGPVWYQRKFFVPFSWSISRRIFIRFGSVNYLAQVWLNDVLVTNHEIGHLPFEVEITSYLTFGAENRITVAVDNTLLETTVPQGRIFESQTDNGTAWAQSYSFDFFNYAGIHRPVLLHSKPCVYVEDINVKTSISGDIGSVKYMVTVAGYTDNDVVSCFVIIRDQDGTAVVNNSIQGLTGTVEIPDVKPWWAQGMAPHPGYLYTFEVSIYVNYNESDIYRLPIGIRTIKWTNTTLLLNDKPVYMRGFGRHEDSVIRGRGLDLVTMVRDYELLKWVGANAYRTSHYPYSDEVMDMADRQGFLIIDECPSVNTEIFSPTLLTKHKQSISELVRRDKNRPSVIIWSIANEPRTQTLEAGNYFQQIALHIKTIDSTRPITAAIARSVTEDKLAQYLDIVSFNRYNAWYHDTGRLDMITTNVINEAVAWHNKHNKPVLMTEYGADTMPGLHELPQYVWSEEYQVALFSKHFSAFDDLRQRGWFVGEFIWNFADFRTAQTYTRVGGNKKGIFTRTREPKMVAHHVRRRYHALGQEIDGADLPNDLEYYITNNYI